MLHHPSQLLGKAYCRGPVDPDDWTGWLAAQSGAWATRLRTRLTTVAPKRIVRSVDRRVYDHLKQAIEDLGAASSFMRAPVRQAKDEARKALADFQQEPLSPALRQASTLLGKRLEDVDIRQLARNSKPLLDAWQVVEREAGSEAWD
jgi:hypothetical protein